MQLNTGEIRSTSDFYQALRKELPGKFIPTAFGEVLLFENETIETAFHRFIFSPGFELALCRYEVKKDIEISWKPTYHALEFNVIFKVDDNKILTQPHIGLQVSHAETRERSCSFPLSKGNYTSVGFFVSFAQLSNFMDTASLNFNECMEYGASMIQNREELLSIVQQIFQRFSSGDPQRLFYHAKSLELLSLLAPTLHLKQSFPSTLCKDDVTSIKKVYQIIHEQYQDSLSIPQLAAMVYMNENKLKASFKLAYGMTIHEAIIARKMEVAYHLVLHEKVAVKDASISVGYSNHGHFIDLFRRHYGFTPGELLSRPS